MAKSLKKLYSIVALIALASCTCATPLVVSEIQKSDKKLTCKDIILEINEAEHYKDLAVKERGIGFGNALMPVCWASSYIDAAKSIDAANARVAYLGKIYDVLDCGGKSDGRDVGEIPAIVPPPPFVQVQPAPQPQSYMPPQQPQVQVQQIQQVAAEPQEQPVIQGEKELDDIMVRNNTHQHVDRFGRIYTHSHPYAGPHRHAED